VSHSGQGDLQASGRGQTLEQPSNCFKRPFFVDPSQDDPRAAVLDAWNADIWNRDDTKSSCSDTAVGAVYDRLA
jgi:hypothetical protein